MGAPGRSGLAKGKLGCPGGVSGGPGGGLRWVKWVQGEVRGSGGVLGCPGQVSGLWRCFFGSPWGDLGDSQGVWGLGEVEGAGKLGDLGGKLGTPPQIGGTPTDRSGSPPSAAGTDGAHPPPTQVWGSRGPGGCWGVGGVLLGVPEGSLLWVGKVGEGSWGGLRALRVF